MLLPCWHGLIVIFLPAPKVEGPVVLGRITAPEPHQSYQAQEISTPPSCLRLNLGLISYQSLCQLVPPPQRGCRKALSRVLWQPVRLDVGCAKGLAVRLGMDYGIYKQRSRFTFSFFPGPLQVSHRAWEEQDDKTEPSCSLLLLPSGCLERHHRQILVGDREKAVASVS